MASVTLYDVARLSGVSIATVSKYLNGVRVKPENEERIKAAIEDCGYNVNFFAKSLKLKRSMTIGVLIPNLASSFYSAVISEVEKIFAKKGYTLLVSGYDNDAKQENAKFQSLISRRVDAILVAPENLSEASLETAKNSEIPVLFFDTRLKNSDVGAVVTNNFESCREVLETLLNRGFQRIAVLVPSMEYSTTKDRLKGCKAAIEACDAEKKVKFLQTSGDTVNAYKKAGELLATESRPDAIFALSSSTFLGSLMAIGEAGLKIPENVAFIGYDNRQISKIYSPNISLVYQPISEIAEKICERLEAYFSGSESETVSVVNSKIVYTESVDKSNRL